VKWRSEWGALREVQPQSPTSRRALLTHAALPLIAGNDRQSTLLRTSRWVTPGDKVKSGEQQTQGAAASSFVGTARRDSSP
jgi:hypothetical protein